MLSLIQIKTSNDGSIENNGHIYPPPIEKNTSINSQATKEITATMEMNDSSETVKSDGVMAAIFSNDSATTTSDQTATACDNNGAAEISNVASIDRMTIENRDMMMIDTSKSIPSSSIDEPLNRAERENDSIPFDSVVNVPETTETKSNISNDKQNVEDNIIEKESMQDQPQNDTPSKEINESGTKVDDDDDEYFDCIIEPSEADDKITVSVKESDEAVPGSNTSTASPLRINKNPQESEGPRPSENLEQLERSEGNLTKTNDGLSADLEVDTAKKQNTEEEREEHLKTESAVVAEEEQYAASKVDEQLELHGEESVVKSMECSEERSEQSAKPEQLEQIEQQILAEPSKQLEHINTSDATNTATVCALLPIDTATAACDPTNSTETDSDTHCDSHESVNETVEIMSKTDDLLNIVENADSGVLVKRTEIKEMKQCEGADDPLAANTVEACDNSDILDENTNQLTVNAINAVINTRNIECSVNEMETKSNAATALSISDIDGNTACNNNTRNENNDSSIEQSNEIEVHEHRVIDTTKPCNAIAPTNDRITIVDSDEACEDKKEKSAAGNANQANSGASKIDNVIMNDTKATNAADKIERLAHSMESVASPDIVPVGFKDKFRKSLEIMGKSKQMTQNQHIPLTLARTKEANQIDVVESPVKTKPNDKANGAESIVHTNDTNANHSKSASMATDEIIVIDDTKKSTSIDLTISDESVDNKVTIPSDDIDHSRDSRSSSRSSISLFESIRERTQDVTVSLDDSVRYGKMRTHTNESRSIIVSPHQEPNAESKAIKSASLYIENPDFSKPMRPSVRDLSELKMKPPDFSRFTRSTELQVPHPDFTKAYDRLNDRRSPTPRDVDHNNFAEVSKKYNYVSDLILKNSRPLNVSVHFCFFVGFC